MMYQHDDLISRLGDDTALPRRHRIRDFSRTMVVTCIAVASIGLLIFYLLGWSIRADYLDAIFTGTVMAKQAIPFLILLTCLPIVFSLGRPEVSPRLWPAISCLMIFPLIFLFAFSADTWSSLAFRPSWFRCLFSIPALAVPLIIAQIWSLRQDAVTRPWVTGGLAGLAAGAGAVLIYAMICTEDGPGFFALWYLLGIIVSGVIGSGAGRLFLRW